MDTPDDAPKDAPARAPADPAAPADAGPHRDADLILRGHAWIDAHAADHEARLVEVTGIPAPTFDEGRRTAYVRDTLARLGLAPETDDLGNVWASLPARAPGPTTLVAAHLDTVFPIDTDVTVRRHGGRLLAPGVGDDSAAVAALLTLARMAGELGSPPGRVILGFTVGEEGLGNLRGIRALLDRLAPELDQLVALDGELMEVVEAAVGSRRHRVEIAAPGGHSWSDFGRPSAVHLMAELVSRLARLTVPQTPRTTFNVGTFHGGTTVNAVAARAEILLDLRSVGAEALDDLEARALAQIDAFGEEVGRNPGCALTREQVGDRPAGTTDNARLVEAVEAAARAEGRRLVRRAGSTDAAAAGPHGLPAICVGVYRGGGAHTRAEWLEAESLPQGLKYLWRALWALQGDLGQTGPAKAGD